MKDLFALPVLTFGMTNVRSWGKKSLSFFGNSGNKWCNLRLIIYNVIKEVIA